MKKQTRWPLSQRGWLWVVWSIWISAVALLQLYRLNHLAYTGFDLGIYTQVMWDLTHGAGWFSSIQDHSYLSDHVEPALLLVWPLFKLWPSPLVLEWSQTIIIASSIFPLYRFAARHLTPWQSFFMCLLFLINLGTYNTATFEFHVLALSFPLLFWAAVILQERLALWKWLLVLICLSAIREEMGLVVIGFSVLAFIKTKNWRWVVPAFGIGVGSVFLDHWIQSWFIHFSRYTVYFPWMEFLSKHQWANALRSMATLFFRLSVLRMLLAGVIAFGGLWLLAAEWIIPAIPTILIFSLADAGTSNILIDGYHATVPMAFFWLSLILGLSKFLHWMRHSTKMKDIIPPSIILLCLGLILCSSWFSVWTKYASGPTEYTVEEISALLAPVSDQEGIVVSGQFLPLLANRTNLQTTWYLFKLHDEFNQAPYHILPDTQWLLLDTNELVDQHIQDTDFPKHFQDFYDFLHTQFTPVDSLGSIILFHRTDQPWKQTTVWPLLMKYESGTPDSIPEKFQLSDEFAMLGEKPKILGQHLLIDLYILNPDKWKKIDEKFITPTLILKHGADQISVPFGFGLLRPDTVQAGDHLVMGVLLPEHILNRSISNQIEVTGELRQLEGFTTGQQQTILQNMELVRTFLYTTTAIQ